MLLLVALVGLVSKFRFRVSLWSLNISSSPAVLHVPSNTVDWVQKFILVCTLAAYYGISAVLAWCIGLVMT